MIVISFLKLLTSRKQRLRISLLLLGHPVYLAVYVYKGLETCTGIEIKRIRTGLRALHLHLHDPSIFTQFHFRSRRHVAQASQIFHSLPKPSAENNFHPHSIRAFIQQLTSQLTECGLSSAAAKSRHDSDTSNIELHSGGNLARQMTHYCRGPATCPRKPRKTFYPGKFPAHSAEFPSSPSPCDLVV